MSTIHEMNNMLNHFGSPLYVYNEDLIRENAQKFMATFKKHIPNFKQYFAVKATPNKHIMEILKEEGMQFDCSSMTELELVGQLSGPSEIMYTSNYTSVEDFENLLCSQAEGILNCEHDELSNIIINLDDIDGLENLCIASTNTKIPLPKLISFRLNPLFGSDGRSEVSSNVLGGTNTKFGIPSDRIIEAYRLAMSKGITNFGIHVMTGSCILDIEYFRELINVVFQNINMICKELGIIFDFVDLGGGIGIPYKPTQNEINLDLLAQTMAQTIKENKEKYDIKFDPVIAMENGRYITGPYGWLISKCKSIKIGPNGKKFYGLDACMANLMRPGMYGAYHTITIPRLHDVETFEQSNVVGSLCENNDWFAKDRLLPIGIQKEDIFVIHDVGAHGYSMGFQYNGKLRSAEVLVSNKNMEISLIREKELTCFN